MKPKTIIHMSASLFTVTGPHGQFLRIPHDVKPRRLTEIAKRICKEHGISNVPKAVSDTAAHMAGGM